MLKPAFAVMLLGACTHAPSAGSTIYVDVALGTDDAAHGHGPGAEAFATITYALTIPNAEIQVAAGAYTAPREQFPLALLGRQQLSCDAGVAITGSGTGSVFELAGEANVIAGCDIAMPPAESPDTGTCVEIASSGPHVVEHASMSGCGIVVDFGNYAGATIREVDIGSDTRVPGNCLNQVGNDVRLESFTCGAQGDWIFNWGTGLSGCGTTPDGRVAGSSPAGSPLPQLDGPC